MYREEPLNKKLDRLWDKNDTLKARIQELEENGRIVNVWNVNWGNINWPTFLAVTAVVLSGLMIQTHMLSTATVVEVERGEATPFRTPVRAAPAMVPPATNWAEFYPTDWVLPEEELQACDGLDNDCGLVVCDPRWAGGSAVGIDNDCGYGDMAAWYSDMEQSADPFVWESRFHRVRYGNW